MFEFHMHSTVSYAGRGTPRQMAEAAQEASIIVTTEKDMMRLKTLPLPLEMKKKLYYQPIEITFSNSEKQKFNNLILNYVASHSRNRRVD